ncbi:TldD/PmbA family protein [Cytophagales bacterium LB-30]|uniref:TldD/PmbA family protein n=1 Tax=Shiella aurantiaca TaxID=3058365 RepID=A0ABT8F105_9BACT|nr:TldD/PmbA family protein [Shiella aurantiaca]MDN4164029.1 TldD/PmbA family protein [Shiella aurantiaca]
MAILTKEQARQILDKVKSFSKADSFEANLFGNQGGNIRYARNTVSTSGEENNTTLVVQSAYGKRVATSTINEFDDASIEKVVRRSEEMAQLAPENPEFMEPLGPQTYDEGKEFFESTANITPEYRAKVAQTSIDPASAKDITAAGFLEHAAGFSAMMNSKGLFAYNKSSSVDFTVTMRSNDGTGSGWVTRDVNDVSKLDTASASQVAIEKALMSREAKAIEPGKYTVILEPAAGVDLLSNMFFSMNARSADEGRSFLSKAGGGTKLGEKLVDERVNIYSDPLHPDMPSSTWSGDGLPIKKVTWFEKGVVKNLVYDRYWASQKGVDPVPFPGGFIMEGGNASLQEMIRDTKKGILVTRLWYIRSVDPQTLLYTGLTRDGTFYIENGKIAYPVKNFRFNESPIIMLNNLEQMGKPERVNGNLVPPLKIRDFTFTSLSDAI